MIEHGWIEAPPSDVEVDVEDLAVKATAEANAPLCSVCRKPVVLTEGGMVKVHFASAHDARPCIGSYRSWDG